MIIKNVLNKLIDRHDLTVSEAMDLMEMILRREMTQSQVASVLMAFRMKGEAVSEILGFIKVMRKFMLKVENEGLVIDTCGTGGDGKNTFNISTAAALVAAGAGIKVAKHGNRSASSICGSADVLESLGVNIFMDEKQAGTCLKETGITFLFAPLYHPSMKNVGPVRKELGIKTVFNFLGPFANPAKVKRQIIGVSDIQTAEKLVKVAVKLEYEKLFIFHSYDGMDEISIYDKTYVYDVSDGSVKPFIIDPENYGLKHKKSEKRLLGGDININTRIFLDVLSGKKGPERDVVLLNSAAAFLVSGSVKNLGEGIEVARNSIDNGLAQKKLDEFKKVSQSLKYTPSLSKCGGICPTEH